MSKTFELWDTATRNLVGAYESEGEALAFVRAYAGQHGPAYPSSWVLLWDDEATEEAGQIAEGPALLARARAASDDQPAGSNIADRRAEVVVQRRHVVRGGDHHLAAQQSILRVHPPAVPGPVTRDVERQHAGR